jgi:hypothetical protein
MDGGGAGAGGAKPADDKPIETVGSRKNKNRRHVIHHVVTHGYLSEMPSYDVVASTVYERTL